MLSDDHLKDGEAERVLGDFVRAYREELDSRIPPAAQPRAMLRERLVEASEENPRWLPVAALAMAACLAVFGVYERGLLRRSADPIVPQRALTPGEARNISIAEACQGSADATIAVPTSVRRAVFREYGIRDTRTDRYEIDYLITPELGGANSIRNLWPEPYSAVWNAHVKDELESRLHGLVCAGQIDLTTAQKEIARDWIGAYKKYFHRDRPE